MSLYEHTVLCTPNDVCFLPRSSSLTADAAVLFNIPTCGRPVRSRRAVDPATSSILVDLYLTDSRGQYDRALTERVEPLWEAAAVADGSEDPSGMTRLVREVDTLKSEQLVQPREHSERAGVIAAITVGCVAVASLVLLAVLLVSGFGVEWGREGEVQRRESGTRVSRTIRMGLAFDAHSAD